MKTRWEKLREVEAKLDGVKLIKKRNKGLRLLCSLPMMIAGCCWVTSVALRCTELHWTDTHIIEFFMFHVIVVSGYMSRFITGIPFRLWM